jgi:ribose transport system permease protein
MNNSNTAALVRKNRNPVFNYVKRNVGMLIALVGMCVIITVFEPNFLTGRNFFNIIRSISMIAILAFGMTMCIIIQGIDLSQGSVVGLTSCVLAYFITNLGLPFGPAIIVSLVASALVGLFNGAFLAFTPLPPFVVTLATQLIARGGCYIITRGNMISIDPSFGRLGNGYSFKVVPNPIIIMLVIFAAMFLLLSKTRFGRGVYALGGNREAARFSGVNIKKTILIVYTLSGVLSGIAGVIAASRITTGQPTTGTNMEFDGVASCYLGGISYLGGEGTHGSTLLGAIVFGVISNGMSMLKIPWYFQNVTKGAIILLAVFFEVMRKNRDQKT